MTLVFTEGVEDELSRQALTLAGRWAPTCAP